MRVLAVTLLLAGALSGSALACGGVWMGKNLVATPKVKAALRAAYLEAHPRTRVGGPVAGRTYYGDDSATRYAVATFGAYPTIFRADGRGRWHVRRETHGGICATVVPIGLINVWWLDHWGGLCFVEPATLTHGGRGVR